MNKKTTAKTTNTAEQTHKSEAHAGSEHLDFSAGNPAAGEASEKARASRTRAGATTLALCVLVTLPPVWKLEDPNAKPYWQIEIRDQQGRRYSDVYRVKELEKAHDLAERIAKDRKLPIVTQEPPAPKKAQPDAVPMPDPETDADEVAPF